MFFLEVSNLGKYELLGQLIKYLPKPLVLRLDICSGLVRPHLSKTGSLRCRDRRNHLTRITEIAINAYTQGNGSLP